MQVSFIIDAGLDSLLEKMSTCHDNPKNSSTTKINKYTLSDYSLFTHCLFDVDGKDCMEWFCKDLKEHGTKITNYEKRKRYY